MNKNRLAAVEYSAAHASYWMNLCVYISFAAFYLQTLGYSNAQLGLILGVGNILSFVLSNAVSSLIDRYPKFRAGDAIIIMLSVQTLMLVVLWFCGSRSPVVSLAYVLLIGFGSVVSSMLIKQWSDLGRSGCFINFGTARAVGSGGYVIMAAFLGVAVNRWSTDALLITGFILTAFQWLLNVLLNRKTTIAAVPSDPTERGTTLIGFLKGNRSFTLLLGGLILIFFAHNISNNFFVNIINALGGSTTDLGYLNALIAVLEVPTMLLYHRICRNRKLSRLLAFSLLMFPIKQLCYALAPSMPLLYLSTVMQIGSFALYTPTIVDYVGANVPVKDLAKGQTLAFSTSTLGSVFASMIGGMLFDAVSVRATLFVSAGICILGALLCVSALRMCSAEKREKRKSLT